MVYVELNPTNKKIRVSSNRKEIQLKDGDGNDTNVSFRIISGDATSLKMEKIIGQGKVKIRIKYDDNPGYAGEAVRRIKIETQPGQKRKHKGEETKVVDLGFEPLCWKGIVRELLKMVSLTMDQK